MENDQWKMKMAKTQNKVVPPRQYLYAIVGGAPDREWGACGIDGNLVRAISDGWVSAVVSDLSCSRIRPERRYLAAHQQVLKRLMEETSLLPLRFGTIAHSTKAVRRILSHHQERFFTQLNRVAGKVEMGLRVSWDVPNIFEYFVNRQPELRRRRDQYLGSQGQGTQEDKLEIGRLFNRLLNEEREACVRRVEKLIARRCAEIQQNPCRNEREIMSLACLVERTASAEFESAVMEAAQLFDHNFAFDYNGPWAPHNFVDLDLEL